MICHYDGRYDLFMVAMMVIYCFLTFNNSCASPQMAF